MPEILKADRIEGHRLLLRDVVPADCAFIFDLRTSDSAAAHISATPPDRQSQIDYVAAYQRGSKVAYFIICETDGTPLGTVRLYDPQEESFAWGSWILRANAPRFAAIESALIVYHYALDHLGFSSAHFSVREENAKVWQFHERFGAKRYCSEAGQHHFRIGRAAILASLARYRRFLPNGIRVSR